MKKTAAILFACIILLSGMHFSVATHICCGELAEVKYSFSGEKAGCGMEDPAARPATSPTFHTDCCKNRIATLAVDQQYVPVFQPANNFATTIEYFLPDLHCFVQIPEPQVHCNDLSGGPPLSFPAQPVQQSLLCVFLI